MTKKGPIRIRVFLILALVLYLPQFCFSQSAVEKATSEVDRLGNRDIEKLMRRKALPPQEQVSEPVKPEVSTEEEHFLATKIELVGCETFPPEDFADIVGQYNNREITLSDLNILASEIEREYLKKGVVAAVFVPPQDVKSGVVTLQVVEAKMGKLEILPHKYFVNNRLRYYWDIEPGEILRYDKMSKALQIMSRNPDREVKSILRAGKKPGTTDVILSSEVNFPVHVFATFDNDGTTSTGKSRTGLGVRHNNFLGLDDTLLAGTTSGIHFNGRYIYHSVPISPKNTFLTYGYSTSHSVPKQEFAQYGISSDADATTFSLHQEFYSPEAYLGDIFLGFDAKDKVIRTSNTVYNKDRFRMASVGGSYIYRGQMSNTNFSTQFYRGLHGFGASPKGNPLASRGGQARPEFSKLNFDITHVRALPLDLQANVRYRQQIAFDVLAPQEEFNLGGLDSVRGYPAADFLADNARIANLEITSPAFFIPENWQIPYAEDTLKNQTSLVGFFDYGHGDRKGTMFGGEKRKVDYMGVGAGVRFKLFNQASLRLEWAYQLGEKSITESGKTHFHFAVNFQDMLPEEVQRIKKIVEEQNIQKWSQQLVDLELSQPMSPVREKLNYYFAMAEAAKKENRLEEARSFYQQGIQLSNSLLMQAQEYVRSYVSQGKEMKEKIQLAQKYYNDGRYSQAKGLLSEVVGEAKLEPASFEY